MMALVYPVGKSWVASQNAHFFFFFLSNLFIFPDYFEKLEQVLSFNIYLTLKTPYSFLFCHVYSIKAHMINPKHWTQRNNKQRKETSLCQTHWLFARSLFSLVLTTTIQQRSSLCSNSHLHCADGKDKGGYKRGIVGDKIQVSLFLGVVNSIKREIWY